MRLAVEDDGPGFDAALVADNHGLSLLRDRLAATFGAAATLRVDPRPGACAVILELPDMERPV